MADYNAEIKWSYKSRMENKDKSKMFLQFLFAIILLTRWNNWDLSEKEKEKICKYASF